MTEIEKKKRGRPKKVADIIIATETNIDVDIARKRGRRKKVETVYQYQTTSFINTREEHTYMIMLDIKGSDLDTTTTIDTNKKGNEKLIFDELIEMFSSLLKERNNLVENNCQINKMHQDVLLPDGIDTNFMSNYNNNNAESNLVVLPIFKINGDIWPIQSPYSCWNCDFQFDSPPIGIPEHMVNNQFHCFGNFCSFPCAGRYIVDMDQTSSKFDKLSLLNTMYQISFNLDVTDNIVIANKKEVLHKYGGSQSYSQYHDQANSKKIELYRLPIIPVYCYIYNQEQKLDVVDFTKASINCQ